MTFQAISWLTETTRGPETVASGGDRGVDISMLSECVQPTLRSYFGDGDRDLRTDSMSTPSKRTASTAALVVAPQLQFWMNVAQQ